jgi:hypothetical protein
MTVDVGFTGEQIRQLVFEYCGLRHGQRGPWMDARPHISKRMMARWRSAVFDSDVDRGMVPRQTGAMHVAPGDRQSSMQRREIDRARHDQELERRDARIRQLEETNELLGKAIGLLHAMNVPEPADTPTKNDPTDS